MKRLTNAIISEVKVVSEKLTDEIKTVKGDIKRTKDANNIIENLRRDLVGHLQITNEQKLFPMII